MRRGMFLMKLFSVAGVLFLLFLVPAMSETQTQESEMSKETQVCSACHKDVVEAFTLNPHAVLDTKGLAQKAGAEFSCASCHEDSAEHLKKPGQGTIFVFKAEDLVAKKTQQCQTCHQESNPRFFLSPHAKTGMDCTSCHSVHSGDPARSQLSAENVSETCRDCHLEAFAKFSLNNRHRLQEGILECTSCHNPHEPSTRARLAGFKQAACFECHTDKQGPFVFEHGSVLIEGCASCHEPHGSVNRHMLTFQNVGDLCYSCHVTVPGFHSRFTAKTYCTDCHSTIHGSNLSPVFLN